MQKPLHLTGLNGIRAIAALGVVISHITLALPQFGIDKSLAGDFSKGLDLAGFGVSMFFCLSGFLITYLLLKEKEATQKVDITKFYARRVLRIWPLYYLYLFISCAFLAWQGSIDNQSQLPYYIFLAANVPYILGKGISLVGHYWSLGVEEQFYMFWPFVARLSKRWFFVASLTIAVAMLLAKAAIRFSVPNFDSSVVYQAIHVTRFHCMLFGAVASILYNDQNRLFLALTQNIGVQLLAWFSLLLIIINKFHIASFIDNELVSLITVVLIIGQITKKNNIVSLDKKLFNFFGKISFGVYVIHPLLIALFVKVFILIDCNLYLRLMLVYTSIISATTALAYLSYNYYEKPFLRTKRKYTVIESQASISK